MDRVKRIWYLSPMRAAKVQASLRIRAVSPEPPLLAHTSSESRGAFRQKARSLAPLNSWACAVKICRDGMLEDTNSLDGAQITDDGFMQTANTLLRRKHSRNLCRAQKKSFPMHYINDLCPCLFRYLNIDFFHIKTADIRHGPITKSSLIFSHSWQSSTHPLLSSKSINCHFIYAMVIHVQLMLSVVINQRRWVGCGVLFVALPGLFVFAMSFWTNRRHLSHDMTKPTKWVCAQRRLRSAWASAQSDLSLLCPLEEGLGP